jgi:hypothetical protein
VAIAVAWIDAVPALVDRSQICCPEETVPPFWTS